ncbi:hypothetical protein [Paenibacillus sp. UASWS1643]|uniref:hypothetical protein n=1 Tax=Paenibacillus sp. UASWS1643 TaxID=2580422 RepID=UPI001238529E|nr:hypothetical protein [Paenibacillus sp. UASWS1643]KAA8747129.1 hypothetical protein FE296_23365 [Paenibacillus sp. UASWS1643]
MKQIKVVCVQPFRVFNQSNELIGEVNYSEELVANLYEGSEEYFAADVNGRKVYVGCLDMNGELELEDCFELVEEGADKQ